MSAGKATNRIGVLGGIGPESTNEFYGKLITELQSRGLIKGNKDFPQIIINSIPAPELVYENITDEDLSQYIDGLKQLDRFGVDFIVMVCNTIHLFYDDLQKQINTPILDLRKEVKRELQEKKVKSVLVLGTPGTLGKGLYNFNGINSINPTREESKELAEAIVKFNSGVDKIGQGEKVKKICKSYIGGGKAEVVLLGCTEFGLMLKNGDFSKINTIDVLVDATIRRLRLIPGKV